jgi:hypothetical protein
MVTTRRQEQQQMQQGDADGGIGPTAAAEAARSRAQSRGAAAAAANGGSAYGDGATLTPEQHRARLDEYRAAWAPPKTLAGRVHA